MSTEVKEEVRAVEPASADDSSTMILPRVWGRDIYWLFKKP